MKNGRIIPQWSERFSEWTGTKGGKGVDWSKEEVELAEMEEREGKLWKVCREVIKLGWFVDARSYYTSFRIDLKKSFEKRDGNNDKSVFEKEVAEMVKENGLKMTMNLGKVDIYPSISGKDNAAKYVIKELGIEDKNQIVGMFDDHNDIEFGLLCGRCFLPGVTHKALQPYVDKHENWTVMQHEGPLGTEEALKNILALVQEHSVPSKS